MALLAGCARFHPQPISPDQTAAAFDSRSLTNAELQAFLETNHLAGPWPRSSWNLDALTLVAFYYQPALAEARAQWASAQAAKITAGERPNPTLSATPGYDSQIPGNFSPWLVSLNLDVPVETAGKRGKRLAQAGHLSEAARWNFVSAAWQTRSRLRAALLNLYSARETGRCWPSRNPPRAMSSGCWRASSPSAPFLILRSPRPGSPWTPRGWHGRTPMANGVRRGRNWRMRLACRCGRWTA